MHFSGSGLLFSTNSGCGLPSPTQLFFWIVISKKVLILVWDTIYFKIFTTKSLDFTNNKWSRKITLS